MKKNKIRQKGLYTLDLQYLNIFFLMVYKDVVNDGQAKLIEVKGA